MHSCLAIVKLLQKGLDCVNDLSCIIPNSLTVRTKDESSICWGTNEASKRHRSDDMDF